MTMPRKIWHARAELEFGSSEEKEILTHIEQDEAAVYARLSEYFGRLAESPNKNKEVLAVISDGEQSSVGSKQDSDTFIRLVIDGVVRHIPRAEIGGDLSDLEDALVSRNNAVRDQVSEALPDENIFRYEIPNTKRKYADRSDLGMSAIEFFKLEYAFEIKHELIYQDLLKNHDLILYKKLRSECSKKSSEISLNSLIPPKRARTHKEVAVLWRLSHELFGDDAQRVLNNMNNHFKSKGNEREEWAPAPDIIAA